MRTAKMFAALAIPLIASACAGGANANYVASTPAPTAASAPPETAETFRAPQVMRGSGIQSVIGEQEACRLSGFVVVANVGEWSGCCMVHGIQEACRFASSPGGECFCGILLLVCRCRVDNF